MSDDHAALKADPDYALGFEDEMDGVPPQSSTAAYLAGREGCKRVRAIFADNGFAEGPDGSFEAKFTVGGRS